MARKSTRQHAAELLDKLVQLDREANSMYYDMGQILHSFREGDLWQPLGYESMGHMVSEELSFSPSTAYKYADTFWHFKRLHYKKEEALDLIEEISFTGASKVLPGLNKKVGGRAARNRLQLLGPFQVTFMLPPSDYKRFEDLYEAMGGRVTSQGRRKDASEIFSQMLLSTAEVEGIELGS